MRLHTCGGKDAHANLGHPCGRAIKALRDAGHEFEIQVAPGYRALPWTRWGQREYLHELSGQRNVPVLETDAGEVVTGSGTIARWAAANPAR